MRTHFVHLLLLKDFCVTTVQKLFITAQADKTVVVIMKKTRRAQKVTSNSLKIWYFEGDAMGIRNSPLFIVDEHDRRA